MSVPERGWASHRVDLPMEPWLVMLLFLQTGFIFEPDTYYTQPRPAALEQDSPETKYVQPSCILRKGDGDILIAWRFLYSANEYSIMPGKLKSPNPGTESDLKRHSPHHCNNTVVPGFSGDFPPFLKIRVEDCVIGRHCYIFRNAYLFCTDRSEECIWNGVLGKTHSLHKRGLLELSGTIRCGTGRTPLAYLGYGCYCGIGGHGWPKDKSDWCCHRHDCCYGFAEEQGCNPKSTRYRWSCRRNTVVCDTVLDRCQQIVCQCDREAAECWRSATFNRRYILFPNFLCGHTNPMCTYYDNGKRRKKLFKN